MLRLVRLARWLTVLLLAAAVLVAGAGWYFSGQIAHEALALDPYVPRTTMTVVAVRPGSVTLRGSEAELRRTGTYGVFWATGFGQVTGRPAGGRDVIRVFHLLQGTPPRAGERIGITGDAYPDDPALALGTTARAITYTSPAGAFPAWYVPGRGGTWAVLVHGKGSTRAEMLRMMRATVRLGLPSLDIGYRNDAGTPLDPSRYYRYGVSEWVDLDAAVAWAQERGARRVVLIGASMGGAVIASFLEKSARARLAQAVVLDAPVLSFDRVVDLGARRRSVPSPLTWVAKRLASLRYGVDWEAADHLDDTRWVRVPVLLLHGTADTKVPFAGSVALAKAEPAWVTFVPEPGVAHVEGWNHDPARYEAELRRFLLRTAATPAARP